MKKLLANISSEIITKVADTHATADSAWWVNKPKAPAELKK